MKNVSKTLYIPLYGKALVSRKGLFLQDPKAEQIWAAEGFPLKGKSASKWLAYYMGIRSAVFDRWTGGKMAQLPDAAVLHLGCGLDSRVSRVGGEDRLWFDVDFPQVIEERSRYYQNTSTYHMIPADLREKAWMEDIPKVPVIVVMEGVSMYLRPEELETLLKNLTDFFPQVALLMDCYSTFAAKASRFKNPINDVGVTQVYGLDDPNAILGESRLAFAGEHDMTPEDLIAQLPGGERFVFRKLYAGGIARKMYRLFEYHT